MATLIQLADTGRLFKLDPQLEVNEREWRMIYASPRLKNWIENDLPGLVSTWAVEMDPVQQLARLIHGGLDFGLRM
jgi:hypothetical protein